MKLKSLLHYINNARQQTRTAYDELTKAANEIAENGGRAEEDIIETVEIYLKRSKQLITDGIDELNRYYWTVIAQGQIKEANKTLNAVEDMYKMLDDWRKNVNM